MSKSLISPALVLTAALFSAGAALAQVGAPTAPAAAAAPAGGGRAAAPLQVPNPTYQSVTETIDVARPVAQVWARIGKYCDIGEWGGFNCQMLSGKDGELGAVRSVGNEVLVAKTQYSYTYTQPVREGALYNLYHGTLEARSTGPNTTQLIYSLVWDNSIVAEAGRVADLANRHNSATRWLGNMKILAEGGTLPPPAPRGGAAPAAGPAPAGRGQ